jgi:hypothetical protein
VKLWEKEDACWQKTSLGKGKETIECNIVQNNDGKREV